MLLFNESVWQNMPNNNTKNILKYNISFFILKVFDFPRRCLSGFPKRITTNAWGLHCAEHSCTDYAHSGSQKEKRKRKWNYFDFSFLPRLNF